MSNKTKGNKRPIYLDYHSTTPVDPRVADKMLYYMTTAFGNASSTEHEYGDEAEEAVKKAAKHVADLVGASPKEVVFTSGATESINIAIQGHVLYDNSPRKHRIAVSPVEHKAVLDTCESLSKRGLAEIIYLKVDSAGRIDLKYLEETCSKGLSLLCVMAANNEIGNIYPVEEMGKIAKKYAIPFLCDASQAAGKIPLYFEKWGITFLALSAHKMYGPKGCGALILKKGAKLSPIIFGGGHQHGIRPGTLSVPGIVGLGESCCLRKVEMIEDEKDIMLKRDKLQKTLQACIPKLVINGDVNSRLAGNLHISIPGIPNSAIIARVRPELAISTGAACSSGVEAPSHVLRALGLPSDIIEGSLRIGIGKFTTDEDIEQTAQIISKSVEIVKNLFDSEKA